MGRQSNLYGEHGLMASGVAKKYTQRVDGKLALSVRFQDGVVSENGRNGVYVEDLIEVAIGRLSGYNRELPSRETSVAITKLQEALMWLDARRADREARGVWSTDKA